MRFFKNADGEVFSFNDDGSQDQYISADMIEMTAQEIELHLNPPKSLTQQILELESQQTPRRIREAALGVDNGWLANLDAQILALRVQLNTA